MIQQTDRINYWEQVSEGHMLVAHNADIMEGATVVDQRKSFCADIADELVASEILKLHFPCVVANLVNGAVIQRADQNRFRYQNKLSFVNRFSIESNEDPCIPNSKEIAFNITYNVMMDFLKKLMDDYANDGSCGYFKFLDETSIRWEALEIVGSNMCGWDMFFVDEEPMSFGVATGGPSPWEPHPDPEETDTANKTEIIYFGAELQLTIPWTDERKARFGVFPLVQVWKFLNGEPHLVTVVATADAAPEAQTFFTIQTPGVPGFVVIK